MIVEVGGTYSYHSSLKRQPFEAEAHLRNI